APLRLQHPRGHRLRRPGPVQRDLRTGPGQHRRARRAHRLRPGARTLRLRPGPRGLLVTGGLADVATLPAILAGAMIGGGVFLLIVAIRGVRPHPGRPSGRSREELVRTLSTRTALAAIAGVATLIVTRWPVAAVGTGLLVLGWNTFG